MKVLIVSRSFYPENSPRSFRTTELVKEMCRQGHDVTLICPYKPEIQGPLIKEFGFSIIDLEEPKWTLLTRKENKVLDFLSRGINRALNLLFEYPDVFFVCKIKMALKGLHGYDLMISIAYPHPIHWGVSNIRTKKNQIAKTWVADCGDPYMGNKMETYKRPFYFKFVEKAWCKKADYITVPIENAKKAYYTEFLDKIKVIPQGFKFEETEMMLLDYVPNKILSFVFAGGFIPNKRDPSSFLEYLCQIDKDFRFYIYTSTPDLVNPYKVRLGKKLIINSYIARSELIPFLSKMDFLVNFENNVAEMLPSKFIDYSLVKRPILNLNGLNLDFELINHFMERNYSQKLINENIDRSRIENVCQEFIKLTK